MKFKAGASMDRGHVLVCGLTRTQQFDPDHPPHSNSFFLTMSYRPETFTIKGLQDSLASAPRRLLLICVCQILLLCCGVFVGHGSAECEVRLPQGSAIEGKNNSSVAVAHPVCGLVD